MADMISNQLPKTLERLPEKPLMKNILDRKQDIIPIAKEISKMWVADLYNRKPAPALYDGVFQGTDLDLSTFLQAIVERGAIINIDQYQHMRGTTGTEDQYVVSKENRHGKAIGLTCNQSVFNFGLNIIDTNVMQSDKVGSYRTFNLTKPTGDWYQGCGKFEFMPDAKENDFLNNRKLWTNNTVIFKNFVHPSRYLSIYGVNYFTTKAALKRINDEILFLTQAINLLKSYGIPFPENYLKTYPKTFETGETKTVSFEAMRVEVDLPDFKNNYILAETLNSDTLTKLYERRKLLIYDIKPKLSFAVRSCELANYKYAKRDKLPYWIYDMKWEKWVEPEGFSITDRLVKKQDCAEDRFALNLIKNRGRYGTLQQMAKDLEQLHPDKPKFSVLNKVSKGKPRTEWEKLVILKLSDDNELALRRRFFKKSEKVNVAYEEGEGEWKSIVSKK